MPSVNLRHSVRAIILDENNRFLLCRFAFPHPAVPDRTTGVWAAPGGGVERGETPLAALRRELHEEVGLAVDADPSHVWHRRSRPSGRLRRHDQRLLPDPHDSVRPRGAMSDDELAAENITELRWWRLQDLTDHEGPDLFSGAALCGGVRPATQPRSSLAPISA